LQCDYKNLSKQRALQVECGSIHTAVRFENGTASLFGSNEFGQCSSSELKGKFIHQIACENNWTAVICNGGQIIILGSLN